MGRAEAGAGCEPGPEEDLAALLALALEISQGRLR
jgi:hypothetical protein